MPKNRTTALIIAAVVAIAMALVAVAIWFLPISALDRLQIVPEAITRGIVSQEDLAPILASIIASIVAAFALGFELLAFSLQTMKRRKETSPSLRLKESISELSKASDKTDSVIRDVLAEMKARQCTLDELGRRYNALSKEERTLSQKLETLRQTPVEVAQIFQEINERNLQQAERKRARRDTLFFILGIIVTTAITVVLGIVGLG